MAKTPIIRGYQRTMSKSEIKELQEKYLIHMKRSRGGFLERPVKQRLLHVTNWEEETDDTDISKYFYEVREHAKTAFEEFLLLCDVLTESQIKDIFQFKAEGELLDKISHEGDGKKSQHLWHSVPSMENILRGILKTSDTNMVTENIWKDMRLYEQPDSWKFNMAHHIIEICFEFLKENRFITSKAHQRLVEEVLDMLGSESHNTLVPKYWRGTSVV